MLPRAWALLVAGLAFKRRRVIIQGWRLSTGPRWPGKHIFCKGDFMDRVTLILLSSIVGLLAGGYAGSWLFQFKKRNGLDGLVIGGAVGFLSGPVGVALGGGLLYFLLPAGSGNPAPPRWYRRYLAPTKILGGGALTAILFGLGFQRIVESAEVEQTVLILAIPFVAVFVAIILLYIWVIFMVALRFNDRIPYRTYRPIEITVIAGIVLAVVCLFQPWQLISYKYGFALLLGSILAFILWSHVRPQTAAAGPRLRPFDRRHYVIAGVAGIMALGMVTAALATVEKPEPPYGVSQRTWDRRLRPEQKETLKEEAEHTYKTYSLPFFVFLGLFPGALAFFVMREAAAAVLPPNDSQTALRAATATTGG
jgi:hypothetical protein